ncbi:MAG: transketolase [Armatimonadetes bacterium JP3_11]|nr:MAG: transketolase [Armatimonadetes bacterium CP1_7O]OYT75993.1 MAG: transketolase [Armatimonadetes bacterium JP3_11]RMH08505.1 MAG: transketolase [Armatimonadota bacterium]
MTEYAPELIEALRTKANLLRIHSIRATTKAGSGHPTTCMSAADLIAALFFYALRYDVPNPRNPLNDRVIFSKGHAAPLLYAAWAEAGAFPVEHLDTLREFESDLEGHPTPRFAWYGAATGSLGQGLSIAAGMALALKRDHIPAKVYCLMGDGETAEGAVWEAAAFASYYNLNNLVALVDVNRQGQSQPTMLQHDLETYRRRFEAFGWQVATIDGHDMTQILGALDTAQQAERPFAIVARTLKGKGASAVEDKEGWHGKPLPPDLAEQAIAELMPTPEQRERAMRLRVQPPRAATAPPSPTEIPPVSLPTYELDAQVATREAYGDALVALGHADPRIYALDGDVKNSTFSEKFFKAFPERFVECFIAEQNMVGAAVGVAECGKIPFASSFACFLSRAYDFIRMAAIGRANVKFCGSHAGVSIGEDGPSQMGLEDLAMFRAVPGAAVLYPADAVSTVKLVEQAARYAGIAYIRTTRPKTPVIYANTEAFPIGGCKVVRQSPHDVVTVVGAGVTLHEALKAYEQLQREGVAIRVIDLYSVKPIDSETLIRCGQETNGVIITVEDHYPEGGLGEAVVAAVNGYGVRVHRLAVREVPRSGKPETLLAAYGIDAQAIIEAVRAVAQGAA